MMSANGIWKVEMLGPYGWEPVATAFLEDGIYRGASENHYTVGTYEVSGNRIGISTFGVQHGKARTVFGKKKKELNLKLEGEIEGDEIKGQAQDDKGAYQITFRCTRLADLP
jgi:hypothetical protein